MTIIIQSVPGYEFIPSENGFYWQHAKSQPTKVPYRTSLQQLQFDIQNLPGIVDPKLLAIFMERVEIFTAYDRDNDNRYAVTQMLLQKCLAGLQLREEQVARLTAQKDKMAAQLAQKQTVQAPADLTADEQTQQLQAMILEQANRLKEIEDYCMKNHARLMEVLQTVAPNHANNVSPAAEQTTELSMPGYPKQG